MPTASIGFCWRSALPPRRASPAENGTDGAPAIGITYPTDEEYDAAVAERCGGSGFYLRGDVANVGVYFQNGAELVEDGASLSITGDSGTTTATVDGVAGYVFNHNCLPRPEGLDVNDPFVSGYVISPWLLANGTLFNSEEDDGDTKAQAGLSGQVELASAIFEVQYLTATPYYQTDFKGEAEIHGGTLSWRPYLTSIHLGGTTTPAGAMLDIYWSVDAIADYFYVGNAGSTELTEGTEYAWLGGSIGVNGWILPDALDDRLTFTTRFDAFWDAYSKRSVDYFEANISWAITPDKNAAIALAYKNGTDKDTLVDIDQWDLGLTFKY